MSSDLKLASLLKERIRQFSNVQVIEGDALKLELPACNKIVSNLPYSISKKITVKLIEHGFNEAFLLYQKEFAEKLLAKPGEENYRFITALVQSTCTVEKLMEIPPTAFKPEPKVSSALVKLKQKTKPEKGYVTLLQELFNHKNKNLKNILKDVDKKHSEKKPAEMTPEELREFCLEFIRR